MKLQSFHSSAVMQWSSGSQTVVPGTAVSASLGNLGNADSQALLEMV